jgi:hypothetical protein
VPTKKIVILSAVKDLLLPLSASRSTPPLVIPHPERSEVEGICFCPSESHKFPTVLLKGTASAVPYRAQRRAGLQPLRYALGTVSAYTTIASQCSISSFNTPPAGLPTKDSRTRECTTSECAVADDSYVISVERSYFEECMAPQDETTADRVESAKAIVKLFSLERYSFFAVSLITAAFVVYVGVQAVLYPAGNKLATLGALFGSGGVVTFNIARLLSMFNKVIDAVFVK